MTRQLEDITVEEMWQIFLSHDPPPADFPADQLNDVRRMYFTGFAAMLAIATRLQAETPTANWWTRY